MKKNNILAVFAIILTTTTGLAQTPVTIHSQNTQPTFIDAYDIDGFVFERVEGTSVAEDEWIDLGLPSGVLWRSSNFGSGHPTASGTYIPCKMWKEKGLDCLAEVCGYQMRAPGSDDVEELFANCTVEKYETNGVAGVKFTGPNGNSIFLPAAGVHYTDDSNLWRNMICAYWTFQHYNSNPILGWSINVEYPADNLTGLTQDSFYFNHPIDRTLDFCLYVRPVKDTVIDANVIYDCQDWPQFDLDGSENVVSFEIIANNTPVISTEADFITWEITEGDEVPLPDAFEQFFDSNPTTLSGSFRKWTITFTLTPNSTYDWRNATICFKGKRMPWGEDGYIHVSQAPSQKE